MGRITTAVFLSLFLNALRGVVALDNGLAITPQMGWVREKKNPIQLNRGNSKLISGNYPAHTSDDAHRTPGTLSAAP
jgi:hypothetical protein